MKWSAVAPLLPFAMLWGILAALSAVTDSLLLSRREPRRCLIADVIALAGTAILLLLLLRQGPITYLAGLTSLYSLIVCLSLFWLIQIDALKIRGVFSAILPPIICCLISFLICEGGRRIFAAETTSFVSAAIYGTSFFVFYIAVLRILFARLLTELAAYLPARKYVDRVLILKTQA
jgi:O-antigen/teichoic acid export membrane protein